MLGSALDKEAHFAMAAKRFALDAKMFRCRAAVHVEDKDDIVFWSAVLKHFRPGDRFHFVAGSRNEYGHETSGVTQCLKYLDCLSNDFFICIDSDYRYLLRERRINIRNFVFQTYTYSFENHHCFSGGLNDVCSQVTNFPNTVFDFKAFLKSYSNIIYDLFIWHLYFLVADPTRFSKYTFNRYLNLAIGRPSLLLVNDGETVLDELRMRVGKKVGYLGRRYPQADLESVRQKYAELGLKPDDTYLFVRGHNVYDMIYFVSKGVCEELLKQQKSRRSRETLTDLFRNRSNLESQIKRNIKFGAYPAIRQIEDDINIFFGN